MSTITQQAFRSTCFSLMRATTACAFALVLAAPAGAQSPRRQPVLPGCATAPDTLPEPIPFERVPWESSRRTVRALLEDQGFAFAGRFGPFDSMRHRGRWLGRPAEVVTHFSPKERAPWARRDWEADNRSEDRVLDMLVVRLTVPRDSLAAAYLALQDSLSERHGRPRRVIADSALVTGLPPRASTNWTRLNYGMVMLMADSLGRGAVEATFLMQPGLGSATREHAREERRRWERRCYSPLGED